MGGGAGITVLGLLMHVSVALWWSSVFVVLSESGRLREAVRPLGGAMAVACVYGPFVWATMSLLVIPMFTHRAPVINARWWIQLVGHAASVGMPIVMSVRDRSRG